MQKKALIIEDSKIIAQLLTHMVRKTFLSLNIQPDITSKYDATSGLTAVNATKYDIIITDNMLPGGTGLSIVQYAKSHDLNKDTPIILISASMDESLKNEALATGANCCLQKPIQFESLNSIISDIFNGTHVNASNLGIITLAEWIENGEHYFYCLETGSKFRAANLDAARKIIAEHPPENPVKIHASNIHRVTYEKHEMVLA
jgi:CheY-like chemotaxis protein